MHLTAMVKVHFYFSFMVDGAIFCPLAACYSALLFYFFPFCALKAVAQYAYAGR